MVEPTAGRELPAVGAERLDAAVRAVLDEQRTERLTKGAVESVKEQAEDRDAALYFQSLLEVGYLAASADGLATQEREALALLIEHATVSAIDRATLRLHFEDLDATSDVLGRRERLARVAANLEAPDTREQALRFAALVAIADGRLDPSEMGVLLELGDHFDFSGQQVETIVERVAGSIEEALQ